MPAPSPDARHAPRRRQRRHHHRVVGRGGPRRHPRGRHRARGQEARHRLLDRRGLAGPAHHPGRPRPGPALHRGPERHQRRRPRGPAVRRALVRAATTSAATCSPGSSGAARVSLFIGVAAVTFGFVIGGTLGLTAGFYGGRYERVVIGAMDIMLAFPALVLALALVTFLSEPGTQNATPGHGHPRPHDPGRSRARADHAGGDAVLRPTRVRHRVARPRRPQQPDHRPGDPPQRGAPRWPPSPSSPSPSSSWPRAALSFLGLSVASPTATWGNLIEQGRQSLDDTPWISLFPCAVMFLTLLSFNYVGDQLRRYFDVKEINL